MVKIKNVLSLFDGISSCALALDKANIEYDNYYSSEVDKKSILISEKNYPNIIRLGDVNNIDFSLLKDVDLITAGSPCQDLSLNKDGGKLGLNGLKSSLFYKFVEAIRIIKPKYFLLENVKMLDCFKDEITSILGVDPIEINSNLVSCQNRKRLYWTNIPFLELPRDKNIKIQDILHDDYYGIFTDNRIKNTKVITKNYIQWDLSGKGYKSQQDRAYFKNNKMCTIPSNSAHTKCNIVLDENNNVFRRIHPVEAERCQNLPDNYTLHKDISDNKRISIIGNGWTIDIISHIFKNIL